MYRVYILKSSDFKHSYVGMTDNLERRIDEHNSGKSFYTKRYLPWILLHTEQFNNYKDARDKEKWYKSPAGRKMISKFFTDK